MCPGSYIGMCHYLHRFGPVWKSTHGRIDLVCYTIGLCRVFRQGVHGWAQASVALLLGSPAPQAVDFDVFHPELQRRGGVSPLRLQLQLQWASMRGTY